MKLFEKNELKLLWPFYLESFIAVLFFFVMAFVVVYFNDLGFSIFQIGILSSAAGFAAIIFEVPTGAIADIYGRKFSVLLGFFFEGLGMLLIFFLTDFYSLVLVFAFIGFGTTFSSGAKQAWVVDLVNSNPKLIKNYFVKVRSIAGFGAIFSGLIGVWFVKQFSLRLAWLLAAVSFLVSIFLLSFAKENFKREKPRIRNTLLETKKQTKKSFSFISRHPVLSFIILASFFQTFAALLTSAYTWYPYLEELGLQDYQFGYLLTGMGVIGFVSPLIAGKFSKVGKERKFIILSIVLAALSASLVLISKSLIFVLAIFFMVILFWMMPAPIESSYFQKFVPSKLRATITSTQSMLLALMGVIALPIVGLIVDKIGPKYSIFLSAIFSLPALFIYLKIREPKNQKN